MSNTKFENRQIIFAINQHQYFGWTIDAFMVMLNDDQSFSMNIKKVNSSKLTASKPDAPDFEKEIVKLLDTISDDAVTTHFFKRYKRFSEAESKFTPDFVENFVRPFIELKLLMVLNIILINRLPLYYQTGKRNRILDKAIEIPDEETAIVFNFRAGEHHLTYYQTIKQGDKQIVIYEKPEIIFSKQPVWLLIDNTLHHFSPEIDYKKLKPFFSKEYILIPKEREAEFFNKFIFKSVKKFEVNPVGFAINEIFSTPKCILKLQPDWNTSESFKMVFDYGVKTFTENDKADCYVEMIFENEKYSFAKHFRNFNEEREKIDALLSLGLKQDYKKDFILLNAENGLIDYISWLNKNSQALLNAGIVSENSHANKYYTGKIEVKKGKLAKHDWFDMKIVICLEGFEIPFYKFRKNIILYQRDYELPDGKIVILPIEWFVNYRELLLFGQEVKNKIRIKKPLKAKLIVTEQKPGTYSGISFDNLEILEPPDLLKAELRNYQKIGYSWMQSLSFKELGCCLADDMGLGKTVQTLSVLLANSEPSDEKEIYHKAVQLNLFENNLKARDTSLIIMPSSLIHNWVNEIHKFAPSLKYMVHEGFGRAKNTNDFGQNDVVLTSYGIVRKDIDFLNNYAFNFIILDESQFIKNPESKIYQSVVQLQAKKRIVLTGTPIENSLNDLWAQMNFINPGLLGSALSFRNEYLVPIEKNLDENKTANLKKVIEPFILRRTKQQVEKELPLLTENTYYCEMTEMQSIYYERKKSQIRNLLFKQIKNQPSGMQMIAILKALMQLRLIANHPVLENTEYPADSGKFEEIKIMTENLLAENHKVLFFSSFVRHLNLFSDYFDQSRIPYIKLTGSTPTHKREAVIADFQQNEDIKVFLISLKAGGYGLNLTASDYVFILDPWWNPAVEMQAINRAHRIGQSKNVFSYKFITKSSIEEKILVLQQRKKELADNFINNNNPLRSLNNDEIEDLFN